MTVPPGHCWLEGDHHGQSLDSNLFGPVSATGVDNIYVAVIARKPAAFDVTFTIKLACCVNIFAIKLDHWVGLSVVSIKCAGCVATFTMSN